MDRRRVSAVTGRHGVRHREASPTRRKPPAPRWLLYLIGIVLWSLFVLATIWGVYGPQGQPR